jgi:hydroxybutyrate-dimer hydrolase
MNPLLSATQINNRCNGLSAKGLLTAGANTQPAQSNEALQRLNGAGYETDSDQLHATHFGRYTALAVALTYENAYARASVKDNLCGYSFAAVDAQATGVPVAVGTMPANASGLAQIFGNGNGVPPTSPLEIINNASRGGPKRDQVSVSARGAVISTSTAPPALALTEPQTACAADRRPRPQLLASGRS